MVTESGAPDITSVCNKADQLANPHADAFMGSEEAESEGLSPTEAMCEYPNTEVSPYDAAVSKEGRHTHTDPACKEPGIQHKHPTETPVPMTFSCQQAAPNSLLPTEVMSDTADEEAMPEFVDPAILISARAAVTSTQSQTEQALRQSSDSGTSFQHLVEPENAVTVNCQQPGSQTVPPAAAMSDCPDTEVMPGDPAALLSDAVAVTEVCTHAQTHQASEQSNNSRVKAAPSTEETSVALASPSQQAGLQSVHDFPHSNDRKSAVPTAAAVGSAATDSRTDVSAPVVASPHAIAAFSSPASAAEVSACESTAPQHQSAQHLPAYDLHTSSLEVAHATAAEPEQAVLAVNGQVHSQSPAADSNQIAATDTEYPDPVSPCADLKPAGRVLAVSTPAASDGLSANSGQIAEEAEGQQAGQDESVPLAAESRQTVDRQVVSDAGQAELLIASNGQNTTMELGSAVPLLQDAAMTASEPEHVDALQWDSASCIVVPDSEEPESFIPIPAASHDNTAGDNSAAHSSAGQAVHHARHSTHSEQFVEHPTAVDAAAVRLPCEPDQSQHGEQPEVADAGHAAAAADAPLLHSSRQTQLHTGWPKTAVQAASRHDLDMTKCLSVHQSADKPDARAQALASYEAQSVQGQDKDSQILSAGESAELCEDEAEQQQQPVHVEEADAEIEQADSSYRQAAAKQQHFEQQQRAAQHANLTEHADTGDAPIMIMSC